MREILFRGKEFSALTNHCWLFGSLDTTGKEYPSIIYLDRFGNRCRVFVDPKTVGQFTGLTDKNGKKIFEGDIIKQINSYDNLEIIGVVRFSKSSQFVISHTYTEKENYYKRGKKKAFAIKTNCEIIDNIHDNPELLEWLVVEK
jgi:uncharacterized phage protein (TIGR01671 family)